MRDKQCDVIRRELEEQSLNDELSVGAAAHVRGCADCREFQRQQMKLRQIVGSLGTVSAPADFDFRLRARLAADSERPGIRYLSFAARALATVGVLVVFGVTAAIVWQSTRPETTVADAPQQGQPQQAQQGQAALRREETSRREEQAHAEPRNDISVAVDHIPHRTPNRPIINRSGQRITAVDRSSLAAKVYAITQPALDTAPVFPIDASLQSVRLSLDDGRGNARAISFPAVTFGSQRVLATGNQLAPKDVW